MSNLIVEKGDIFREGGVDYGECRIQLLKREIYREVRFSILQTLIRPFL